MVCGTFRKQTARIYHGGDVDVVGVWDSEVVLTALQMHNGILLTSLPMAGLRKIRLFLLHSFTMGPGNLEICTDPYAHLSLSPYSSMYQHCILQALEAYIAGLFAVWTACAGTTGPGGGRTAHLSLSTIARV